MQTELLGLHESLLSIWNELDGETQTATALVMICHAGCSGRLRERYAIKWWSEFLPARVTISAMTSNDLQGFTADLTRRLQGQVGSWSEGNPHRELWRSIITLPAKTQRKVLDILETQAVVCTTLVRADLDAKRKDRNDDSENKEEKRNKPKRIQSAGFFDSIEEDAGVSTSPATAECGPAL